MKVPTFKLVQERNVYRFLFLVMEGESELLIDETSPLTDSLGCIFRNRRPLLFVSFILFLVGVSTVAALAYTTFTLAYQNEELKGSGSCAPPYSHNYANPNIGDPALQPKGSLFVKVTSSGTLG
jgi:hypothetical protein